MSIAPSVELYESQICGIFLSEWEYARPIIARHGITEDSFESQLRRAAFKAALAIDGDSDLPCVGLLTVSARLRQNGVGEKLGIEQLEMDCSSIVTKYHLEYYVCEMKVAENVRRSKEIGLELGDESLSIEGAIEQLQKVQAAKNAATSPAKELVTADLLHGMEFPEPKWIIPEIIPEGLTLLAGKPKIGKSWLCLAQAIATACGGSAFGRIEVEQGAVLYLALEDSLRRLRARMNVLMDMSEARPRNLMFDTLENTAGWNIGNGGIDRMRRITDENPNLRMIVVDTFKKIRPMKVGRGNDYDRDYEDLVPLQEFAHQAGIGLVVVHHTRKMKADDIIDEVSGSTGLTGAADTILVLTRSRSEADGVLHVTGRDVEEQELALQKNSTSQLWTILGDAKDVERTESRRKIMETVRQHGELKPKEVADLMGGNPSTIRTMMSKMVDDDELASANGSYSAP